MNISIQAQQFLQEFLPCPPHVEMTRENIREIRNQTLEACGESIDWAKREVLGQLEETTLGGVDCYELKPKCPVVYDDAVILYFFGGGFIQGSVMEDLPISGTIANTIGIRVICPSYSLAPENPYPAAIDQGMAVYRTLRDRYSPERLVIAGESAGGNLALQTLLGADPDSSSLAAACVLLSPWVDLTNSGDSLTANNGRDPTLTLEWAINAAALFAGDTAVSDPRLSPLLRDLGRALPPTLITSGTRDLLLSQCARLATRMREMEVEVELRVWEEMWHVFEWYPQIPEAHQSLAEISRFIANRLPE